MKRIRFGVCAIGSVLCLHAGAQFSLSGQLRTRTEFRNGQGTPLAKGVKPAFFTSQRTRLNFGYSTYRLKLNVVAQDVRIWGQDVSTINRTTTQDNNGMMLHEAWAEILLSDTATKTRSLNVKLGRQELVYDDQRLLGNLDWAQQARRHDAAVLKYDNKLWMLHVGAAFNQNRENTATTTYTTATQGNYASNTNAGAMYKAMQFLYVSKKLGKGNASFLFLADQFSKYHMDTVSGNAVKTFEPSAVSRATPGLYVNNTFNKFAVTASAYYQFGKGSNLQKVNAYLLSGYVQYATSKKTGIGAGVDYTSGGATGSTTKAFDPLYGTPHKFWGLMDYFYVANAFGKGGLTNYYIKARYKPSDKWAAALDLHQFSSASAIQLNGVKKRNLGQEIDVVTNHVFTRQISLEMGYSHYFSTALLTAPQVKNVPDAQSNADWAYLMVIIKPDFFTSK